LHAVKIKNKLSETFLTVHKCRWCFISSFLISDLCQLKLKYILWYSPIRPNKILKNYWSIYCVFIPLELSSKDIVKLSDRDLVQCTSQLQLLCLFFYNYLSITSNKVITTKKCQIALLREIQNIKRPRENQKCFHFFNKENKCPFDDGFL
jgi:hypothetical protein